MTSSTFTNENAGNVITEGSATYQYTPFNMLRQATVNGVRSAYAYDGDNARVVRTGPEGTIYTIRSGSQVLAEYEDSGGSVTLLREYIYLGGQMIATVGRSPSAPVPAVSVTLTNPAPGTVASAGSPVTFEAQPYLQSGAVSRVEYYVNGNWIGDATTAPYTLTRSDLAIGSYQVIARVVTATGQVAASAAVPLTVAAFNAPPTVSLTSPAGSTVIGTGRTLTLTAAASDADGIGRVEFYRGTYRTMRNGACNPRIVSKSFLACTTASRPLVVLRAGWRGQQASACWQHQLPSTRSRGISSLGTHADPGGTVSHVRAS